MKPSLELKLKFGSGIKKHLFATRVQRKGEGDSCRKGRTRYMVHDGRLINVQSWGALF